MQDILLGGVEGRIEARHHPKPNPKAPVVIILHGHPKLGGHMTSHATFALHQAFHKLGFSSLRFNFRGVGRSQGVYSNGNGELEDATTALDWMQLQHPTAQACWIAGHSFGAFPALQLLMRRPEIVGFVAASPPAKHRDFTFLAPCPTRGLIVVGENDRVSPPKCAEDLAHNLHTQDKNYVHFETVPNAEHLFSDHVKPLINSVASYLRSPPTPPPAIPPPS